MGKHRNFVSPPLPSIGGKSLRLPVREEEFARHKSLAGKLECAVYFAHPYHSWERGLKEHTNGLARQYLPKGMPFDALTQRRLDRIVDKINNRPRKSLGYRTPVEVFFSACNFALQI